jgi:hypothetical protein
MRENVLQLYRPPIKTESGHEEGYVWGARLFLYELGVPLWLTLPLETPFFGVSLFPPQP